MVPGGWTVIPLTPQELAQTERGRRVLEYFHSQVHQDVRRAWEPPLASYYIHEVLHQQVAGSNFKIRMRARHSPCSADDPCPHSERRVNSGDLYEIEGIVHSSMHKGHSLTSKSFPRRVIAQPPASDVSAKNSPEVAQASGDGDGDGWIQWAMGAVIVGLCIAVFYQCSQIRTLKGAADPQKGDADPELILIGNQDTPRSSDSQDTQLSPPEMQPMGLLDPSFVEYIPGRTQGSGKTGVISL